MDVIEYEIIRFIENHIVEKKPFLKDRIRWLNSPRFPWVESMIRDMPAIGVRFVLTPLEYMWDQTLRPRGEDIVVTSKQTILTAIKNRREELGFKTKRDMATILGIDKDYYARLENDRDQMPLRTFLRICRILWMDVRVEGV